MHSDDEAPAIKGLPVGERLPRIPSEHVHIMPVTLAHYQLLALLPAGAKPLPRSRVEHLTACSPEHTAVADAERKSHAQLRTLRKWVLSV